jgi:hypothetical protein
MKKLFILIFCIPLMALQCEKRQFETVGTINVDETYEVDQTGHFVEVEEISRDQVLDLLDLPEDAEITEVNIESVSIKVVVLSDNQATAVIVEGAADMGTTSKIEFFNNIIVPLVAVDDPWIGVNTLISNGVNAIKNKLEKIILGMDEDGFAVILEGDSSPTAGNRIHTQIILRITGTVKYVQCLEVPTFIVEGGDPC